MRKPKLPDYGEGQINVYVGHGYDIDEEAEFDRLDITIQLTQLPSRGGSHMPPEAGDYFILQALDEDGKDVKDLLTPWHIAMIDKRISDTDLLAMTAESHYDREHEGNQQPYERPWK